MIPVNRNLVEDVGEAIFQQIIAAQSGLGIGRIDRAIFLAEFIAPVPEWQMSNKIVALIKQAVSDLKREIAKGEKTESLHEVKENLLKFLLTNGFSEPE